MIYLHKRKKMNLDLFPYINAHTADEIICYKTVNDNPIKLGIFYPPNYDINKKYPLFVFIHGGGWSSRKIFSDQSSWAGDHLGFLARYYAEKGYLAISIDYRLMQENGQKENYGLIDVYDDCLDAITYLKRNSKNYSIDFQNSVILGESAGGYLAAALVTLKHKSKPAFSKAILINPITDLTDSHWNKAVPDVTKNKYLKALTREERAAFLSPVRFIDENICPTLLIHGTEDICVRPRHSVVFHDEMVASKNNVELHFIEGIGHAFLLAEYSLEKNLDYDNAIVSMKIIDKWLGL